MSTSHAWENQRVCGCSGYIWLNKGLQFRYCDTKISTAMVCIMAYSESETETLHTFWSLKSNSDYVQVHLQVHLPPHQLHLRQPHNMSIDAPIGVMGSARPFWAKSKCWYHTILWVTPISVHLGNNGSIRIRFHLVLSLSTWTSLPRLSPPQHLYPAPPYIWGNLVMRCSLRSCLTVGCDCRMIVLLHESVVCTTREAGAPLL